MTPVPHVTVCICTYDRPNLLKRLLDDLSRQNTAGAFTFSAVVTDNHPSQSARPIVESCARHSSLSILYSVEPERNIAAARNNALENASGDFIAFIDDDEFPVVDWLLHLFNTCQDQKVAGVLGPVKPHFDANAPRWVVKGGFYDRPTHATGFVLPWTECRTGNALIRRSILDAKEPAFRHEFGTGGEDQDFFRRQISKGHRFIWCNEADVYEVVPPSRWSRRFMLHRALLRGNNSLRHQKGRTKNLLMSVVAVPAYTLALPVLLLAGHHHFMRYLVKLTDHAGRLLGAVGLNPVRERRM